MVSHVVRAITLLLGASTRAGQCALRADCCPPAGEQFSGLPVSRAAFLLMDPDRQRLWSAAGPRVLARWIQANAPLTVGPYMGGCGTARLSRARVLVSDITSDRLWSGPPVSQSREVAVAHGLRVSGSRPLISKDDEVLGTLTAVRSPVGSAKR